ncbi:RNA-binding motif protein X-linked 2 [Taenia crassiceps]|uniref:RNA-binding motif protein X-linked 2 n=1 Tax=Taenia crassiceps TaxID=6207 RepID=A0ABR4Q9G3_9CEST
MQSNFQIRVFRLQAVLINFVLAHVPQIGVLWSCGGFSKLSNLWLLHTMNPITQTRNQNAMNERELHLGYTGTESSWHRQYRDSAWIFVGGLSYDLTEGDVICVFSQYGEIANINLVRDRDTGRSKGFAFVCYENQKSTVLATDNLNGIKLAGRVIRVDHVEKYRVPTVGVSKVGRQDASQVPASAGGELPSVTDYVREHGCGPEAMRRILELQKVNKTSQESSRSGVSQMDRSPSPPRGFHLGLLPSRHHAKDKAHPCPGNDALIASILQLTKDLLVSLSQPMPSLRGTDWDHTEETFPYLDREADALLAPLRAIPGIARALKALLTDEN